MKTQEQLRAELDSWRKEHPRCGCVSARGLYTCSLLPKHDGMHMDKDGTYFNVK